MHTGLVYSRPGRCAVARVVHAYIPRSCRSHKICIFMFPRISGESGEKNNSSNDAVPDPSFFVKGLARETIGDLEGNWYSRVGLWVWDSPLILNVTLQVSRVYLSFLARN